MRVSIETVASARKPPLAGSQFETGQVLAIAGSHLLHDTYVSFVSPLLPLIIAKLSLSLTLAGTLAIFPQLPSLLQPLIGYLADRTNLRYFIILAPAVTVTLMSLIGLVPSYGLLAILLLVVGLSSASFHAPSPALVGQLAGSRLGRAMGLYMTGGELGSAIGPLLAVSAVSLWTLEGSYRLVFLGLLASLILYRRLRDIPIHVRPQQAGSLRHTLQKMRGLLPSLVGIILARNLLLAALSAYLPTFLTMEGASLWLAGASLSILQLAGGTGVLVGGTLSDRWGRRRVLLVMMTAAPLLMLALLLARGWLLLPVLAALGFAAISTSPVVLAVVQEHSPDNRATANGLVMAILFVSYSLLVLAIGALGDHLGLRTAFTWSALIALLGMPLAFFLPEAAS
jgi:FSR family fosmidomycin resistance protein-like MFS transporter